jgi:trigger factor
MSPDLETLAPHTSAEAEPRLRVEVQDLGKWRRRLTILVPPERVRRERQRVTLEYGRKLRLPGFRPGKAPAELVRKRFRAEIEDDLARSLLRAGLREALDERGLDPIAPPVVQSLELGEGDAFRATAELEVRPEMTLSRITGFRIEAPGAEVEPGAVERVLQRLREERAEPRPVDRPAAAGDVVIADVEPVDGRGEPVAGYEVLLGSGQSPPEVEALIEGARAGEEREVVIDERRFRMRLRAVNERVLPAVDDAFAASVSRAASLADLRERLAENLRQEAAARQEREVRDRLVDAIAEANGVEVPESMVDRYVERMLRPEGAEARRVQHAPRSGQAPAVDPEGEAEVARLLRPVAERTLRRHFVVEAVARAQGLEPLDEQVDAYLRERIEPGASLEETRRSLMLKDQMDDLRLLLRGENVFEYLKRHSTIRTTNERPPTGE